MCFAGPAAGDESSLVLPVPPRSGWRSGVVMDDPTPTRSGEGLAPCVRTGESAARGPRH